MNHKIVEIMIEASARWHYFNNSMQHWNKSLTLDPYINFLCMLSMQQMAPIPFCPPLVWNKIFARNENSIVRACLRLKRRRNQQTAATNVGRWWNHKTLICILRALGAFHLPSASPTKYACLIIIFYSVEDMKHTISRSVGLPVKHLHKPLVWRSNFRSCGTTEHTHHSPFCPSRAWTAGLRHCRYAYQWPGER